MGDLGMNIELGVIVGVAGAVIGFATFMNGKKKDSTNNGITLGTVMAKLDFMSNNILDIKTDIRELNSRQDRLDNKISALETKVAILESAMDSMRKGWNK